MKNGGRLRTSRGMIMILPADKGKVTLAMNKNDYYGKCKELLRDEKTYQKLKSDPTNKFKTT